MTSAPLLSVVIPMYNEEEVLPLLVERLRPILDRMDVPYEVVTVDDGSRDATGQILLALRRQWTQLRVIRLRRNSGHQAALTAGLHRAFGAYIVSIDADLQDPPEKIPEMLDLAQSEGLDVVYGVRNDRSSDSFGKRVTAAVYYRLMRRVVGPAVQQHAGDFRLLSRAAVDALKMLPEHQPVYRLLVPWLGFPSGSVTYRRDERAAGRTKYPLSKMIRLALDSITSFSAAPLRVATALGLVTFVLCLLAVLVTGLAVVFDLTVPGWASIFVAVLFLGAVQLICLGLVGEYLGRLHTAVLQRPAYFVGYDSGTEYGPVPGPRETAARGAVASIPTPNDQEIM